ncbi:Hydrophobin 2 [Cordyceps fumosorosea ARSEF 2679]|uniref:Hydrophobin 2 n=1 Tax=Cordyceps fumosorosea (strain ARSEF 2679) TaxID=1081104 RepID=A0A167R720_CORFA|nr:Hydrophobin 2 [Cordyceps fumosorosea ARSEF 2679]OAA58331.1 Hydrophobin 2 [Cordyceps fumosorosea ARSEF 2679]
MQTSLAAALFATVGLAIPLGPFTCPSGLTYNNPQCCAVDVLGILTLDCESPDYYGCDFGMVPACCTFTLLGQALFCKGTVNTGRIRD